MKDPIVEEVRAHRMAHTRKFHGELSAICADLRAIEKTSGHEVVRFPSRRPASNGETQMKQPG